MIHCLLLLVWYVYWVLCLSWLEVLLGPPCLRCRRVRCVFRIADITILVLPPITVIIVLLATAASTSALPTTITIAIVIIATATVVIVIITILVILVISVISTLATTILAAAVIISAFLLTESENLLFLGVCHRFSNKFCQNLLRTVKCC